MVGTSVLRREGHGKLTGGARFVADLEVPGAWWGVTLRSPHPHARLLAIDRSGVDDRAAVVVTAADLARSGRRNAVHLIVDDQPFLAADVVHHAEEAVALVAAPTREAAERAAAAIRVRYRPLPPRLDFEQAEEEFARYRIDRGDVAAAFAAAECVVEGTYRTGHQEHAYLEPNGMIAWPRVDGVRRVAGSLQCPFYVRAALAHLFDEPPEAIHVLQTTTGGGFGGKEDYPDLVAGHAALLAEACGHPVRLLYDRAEDMAATTKRHPSRVRHRTALDAEGRLLGMEVDVLLDGGAYTTLSPVVLSRAVIHAAGPYRCPNVAIRGRAVRTNTPPNGAFRGFGVPQVAFALERHLDHVARTAGFDAVELRRRNLLADGETLATGQAVVDAGASRQALEAALAGTRWQTRARAHAAFNRRHPTRRRGLGLACYFHGSGFTGNGEIRLASEAGVEVLADGRVRVLAASTEMGQGTRTVFAQLVAETLGLPCDAVETFDPDTANVPDSGPTVASRTVPIVGRILVDAARTLDAALAPRLGRAPGRPWTTAALARAARLHVAAGGERRCVARFANAANQRFDDKTYTGDAYAAYAWATAVAEVEVDLVTFATQVLRLFAVQDVGRTVNPVLAAGQVEGGLTQALGWALYEEVAVRDGRVANGQLTNYILPTTAETPPIGVRWLERPFVHGPFGAKGLGELPMDGGAPAVANAVARALGVALDRLPISPERVAAAWRTRDREGTTR